PLRAIVNEDLAEGRLIAGLEGGFAAALGFEPAERELDVLAGAQVVGGEVAAGAEVGAQLATADEDAIRALRLRIGDLEFGKDRMVAEVLELERLLAAELASQLDLPLFE